MSQPIPWHNVPLRPRKDYISPEDKKEGEDRMPDATRQAAIPCTTAGAGYTVCCVPDCLLEKMKTIPTMHPACGFMRRTIFEDE